MKQRLLPVFTITTYTIVLFLCAKHVFGETTAEYSSSKTYETTITRRERNLDHWDAETLAFYLGLDLTTGKPLPYKIDETSGGESRGNVDQYAGIDTAVMFYAQWCPNCHQFAPVWDVIGGLVFSGTTQSNLIMALFNCELNEQHMRLCDGAGVTHYPTLMYVGAGPYKDVDPISARILGSKDKAAGPYGATTLKRAVKFQGDLNIGDSVLDWVKAMKGLSTWYKWNHADGGWLKNFRRLLTKPFLRKKKNDDNSNDSLPIGIPGGSISSTGSTSSYVLEKELRSTQEKVESLKKQAEDSKLATAHAGYLIDAFLFPVFSNASSTTTSEDSSSYVDTFDIMTKKNVWDTSSDESSSGSNKMILKTCMVDISLDYCTRYSTKVTTEYLDSLKSLSDSEYPSFVDMENELKAMIKDKEPYCAIFNDCYTGDFNKVVREGDESQSESNECRPSSCPFKNDMACRYVSTCLSDNIHNEYSIALEKFDSTNATATNDATGAAKKTSSSLFGVN